MAGKHGGRGDEKPGTDAGPAFDTLSGEEKAEEFDASQSDPVGYAARNFGADPSNPDSRNARLG